MGIPAKRRTEILDEIARLGKQGKSTGRGGHREDPNHDKRMRRIAELVLELSGLNVISPAKTLKRDYKEKGRKQ